jgi:hypothetical protein
MIMINNQNYDLYYQGADFREKDHREVIEKLKKTIVEIEDPKFFGTPNLANALNPENIYLSALQKEKQTYIFWQVFYMLSAFYRYDLIERGLSDKDIIKHLKSIWSGIYYDNLTPEKQVIISNLLLKPDYEPPKEFGEIIAHLQTIQIYNSILLLYLPFAISQRIDFAFGKILGVLSMFECQFHDDRAFLKRIRKSIEKKKINKGQRAQKVYEAFYSIDIKGKSLNKIAQDIQEYLINIGQYPPLKINENKFKYTRSIKRYLIEDDNIRKDLNNVGVKLGQM